jgi:hypothetical protein
MSNETITYNVEVTMNDELSGEIVTRTIDKTNAMKSGSSCWELGNEASQRNRLENWIQERANQQHETLLTLISWKFV